MKKSINSVLRVYEYSLSKFLTAMTDYWIGIIMGFYGSLVVIFAMHAMMPEAMDVYQGKTELKYKVVNGEIVDSCVVFKNQDEWKNEKLFD